MAVQLISLLPVHLLHPCIHRHPWIHAASLQPLGLHHARSCARPASCSHARPWFHGRCSLKLSFHGRSSWPRFPGIRARPSLCCRPPMDARSSPSPTRAPASLFSVPGAGFPAGSLSHGRLLPLAIGCRCITPRKRSTAVPSVGFSSLPWLNAWTPGPLCSSVPRTPWRSRLHASSSRVFFPIELALNSTAPSSPSFFSSSARAVLPEPRCRLLVAVLPALTQLPCWPRLYTLLLPDVASVSLSSFRRISNQIEIW